MAPPGPTSQKVIKMWKLHPIFRPIAFSFYMSAIMAFLMCLIIIGANQGIGSNYFDQVLDAYKLAMPSAFVCVLSVRPLVMALVKWTVRND